MNTFSRTIAPSMRSGSMVLPADRLDELMDRIGFYSCSVPVVDQYLLAEFLSGGDFERHINRVRRARRRLVDLNQS
jgi:GntR family transcriptional regulator/MocR family aminotransferase